MMKQQEMVRDFHRKFGVTVAEGPAMPLPAEAQLRVILIAEELAEYREALADRDMVASVDALGDLLYTVLGAAVVQGVDMEPVFAEIHRSNMTKEGNGSILLPHKITKGTAYEPPDLLSLIEAQAGV